VTFPTGSPDESPVVTHEPLTHSHDLRLAEEAVAWARRIGESVHLNSSHGAVDNRAGAADMFSAVYDGRGTCRMGDSDRDSVVSRDLKVHGIEGLRVVDGSVIPTASPYLAQPEVLLVAERAAELLLHEHFGFDIKVEKTSTGLRKGASQEATLPEAPDSWTVSRLMATLGADMTLMDAVNFLGGHAPEQGLLAWQAHVGPNYAFTVVGALSAAAVAFFALDGYRRRTAETRGESPYSPLAA